MSSLSLTSTAIFLASKFLCSGHRLKSAVPNWTQQKQQPQAKRKKTKNSTTTTTKKKTTENKPRKPKEREAKVGDSTGSVTPRAAAETATAIRLRSRAPAA